MAELLEFFKDPDQLAEVLRQSEKCFLNVFDHLPTGIAIQTGDRLVYANIAVAGLVGLTNRAKLPAPSLLDFVAPADRAGLSKQLEAAAASRQLLEHEVRFIQVDGAEVEVELTAVPLIFRDQPTTLFTLQAITEQRVAERLIARYVDIINNLPLGLHVYHLVDPADDRTLRLVAANPAAVQLTGLPMPEVVGKTIDEILPALRRYDVSHKFAEVVRTGQAVEFEQEIFYGDDYVSEAWFSFRAFPLQQNCVGVLFDDLTLRKQAEESLKRSEARYRAIVEDQTELVDRYLPDGTIIFVNDAYCRYFGQKRAELIGRSFSPHIHPEDRDKVQKHIAGLSQTNPLGTFEHRIILPDGQIRWQQWTDRAIFDQQGRLVEFQAVGRDITAQKEAEAERERLLAAEREQRLLAETLHEVTLALTAQTSHEAVLDEILRQTKRLVPYTTANIALLEDDILRTVRWFGYDLFGAAAELVSKLAQSLNEFPLEAKTVYTRQPVIVADTRQEPGWVRHKETLWIRAYMTIPICHQNRVLGMLRLDGDTPHQFSSADARRLLPLANAAAIALENARLYEQARQDAETKSILLNEVNHRVKNNLSAIIGLLYAERRHLAEKDRPAYQAAIQDVINHVQGLATVHTLLSASGWKPLLLSNLIDQVIRAALQSLPLNRHISVKVPPAPIQVTSKQASSLALVINELATNTVKYGLSELGTGQITIGLAVEQPPNSAEPQILVEFRDNGPGFPEDVLHLRQHSVGLYLIQRIVRQDLKGNVTWYNDHGAVTSIRFKAEAIQTGPEDNSAGVA